MVMTWVHHPDSLGGALASIDTPITGKIHLGTGTSGRDG